MLWNSGGFALCIRCLRVHQDCAKAAQLRLPPQFVFQYLMLIIFIHKSPENKEVTDVRYANAVQCHTLGSCGILFFFCPLLMSRNIRMQMEMMNDAEKSKEKTITKVLLLKWFSLSFL